MHQLDMTRPQKMVLFGAFVLLVSWCASSLDTILHVTTGLTRLVLGAVFAGMILTRLKPESGKSRFVRAVDSLLEHQSVVPVVGVLSACGAIAGLVLNVNLFEWLGILLLICACLMWALPSSYRKDILIALAVFYLGHPVPGQFADSFQLLMQRLSVRGAEWALHLFNYRVWADGDILRTASGRMFEVPLACSGMTTAVAVTMCVIGIGALLRFRLGPFLLFVAAGIVQVLGLNVIRIATTVALSRMMPAGWGDRILHDTLNAFLVISVLLVYAEAWSWKSIVRRAEKVLPEGAGAPVGMVPVHIRDAMHRRLYIAAAIAMLAAFGLLAYRMRPHHRAEMIGTVGSDSIGVDNELAQRALTAALEIEIDNVALRTERARAMLLRGRYKEALADIRWAGERASDPHHVVLRAWAYMGLGKHREAEAAIGTVSETSQDLPGISMVKAELAVYRDDPHKAAENIKKASDWPILTERIRSLFPYLAKYEMWDVISDADPDMPYINISHAMLSAHAHLRERKIPEAADVLTRTLKVWPHDARLLRYLFGMASILPGSRWEDAFSDSAMANIRTMSPDGLSLIMEFGLQISRPDITWAYYEQLAELDPTHPSLFLLPAWQADNWFQFRKQFLGLASGPIEETLELTPEIYRYLGRSKTIWGRDWDEIPMVDVIGSAADPKVRLKARNEMLKRALQEFAERGKTGKLSLELQYRYVTALELAGALSAAQEVLEAIEAENEQERLKVRLVSASIFSRRDQWEKVYERVYEAYDDEPAALNGLLRLCEAQQHIRLGLGALSTARRTVREFPESTRAAFFLAKSLSRFGDPEQALAILERTDVQRLPESAELELVLLTRTQRYVEARRFARQRVLEWNNEAEGTEQPLRLPSARMSLQWHRLKLPSDEEFEQNAEALEAGLTVSTSSYMRSLIEAWLSLYERTKKEGFTADEGDMRLWRRIGRTRQETAAAMNQLCLLLLRNGDHDRALRAAAAAVDLLPESAHLWRMLIGLNEGDAETIAKARFYCPADGEIWLAWIVTSLELVGGGIDTALIDKIRQSGIEGDLPSSTLARAAILLLKNGQPELAAALARHAESHSRGSVAVHVVAMQCALGVEDPEWTVRAAGDAIEFSVDPDPLLFRVLVDWAGSLSAYDADFVYALKRLRELDPGNPAWAELMGAVRFSRGAVELIEAGRSMKEAIEKGSSNRLAYMIAAEAARLMGKYDEAVDMLRQGRKLYPDDVALLNNLIYSLAESEGGLDEALKLSPLLIEQGGDNAHFADTVASVYITAGEFEMAEKILDQQKLLVADTDDADRLGILLRTAIHKTRILMYRGDSELAQTMLRTALTEMGRGVEDSQLYDFSSLASELEDRLNDSIGAEIEELFDPEELELE